MSSILPGFEYDIFISYRQKDNKHDGWVTEFVNQLQGELEATFKEDISVYFDINPTDGLLESHDVDASLKDKLKCLVFIPIISRTYCDPRSFAWEHEFKAFVEQASKDRFVKLPNGNVASRVLPVRIHDLDAEDRTMLERELGGVLRAIEFIYKEPGVCRPLTPVDDEKKNLNNTRYRNQINKVAHAIEEIIHSLKKVQLTPVEEKQQETLDRNNKNYEVPRLKGKSPNNQKLKKWLITSLVLILCISGAFAVFKIIHGVKKADDLAKLEKSIAVLPFINDSPNEENTYFINGIMDEVLNNLQKIKDFRVISRTSVEKYRGVTKPSISKIANDLGVNYIIEGSGQKYGNKFVLRVQLITGNNEKHLWGESYERDIQETSDIIDLQSQIAQTIASELRATITPEEKQLIDKIPTTNLAAYDFYLKGEAESKAYWLNYFDDVEKQSLKRAQELYKKALKLDPEFALPYAGLAGVYISRHGDDSYLSKNYLDSVLFLADMALTYDNQMAKAYFFKGEYYFNNGKTKQAIKEYEQAIKYDPKFTTAYRHLASLIYLFDGTSADYVKGIEYLLKAESLNQREDPEILVRLGDAYGSFAGFPEIAKQYYQEAFQLDGDLSGYGRNLSQLEILQGNYQNAYELLYKNYEQDSTGLANIRRIANVNYLLGRYEESLKYLKKIEQKLENLSPFNIGGSLETIGYIYWLNGNKKEAAHWFDKQKLFSEVAIRLGRDYSASGYAYYDLAGMYSILGDRQKAYENLNEFAKIRICPWGTLLNMKNDPIFSNIRNEPEFQKIIKTMETKYQAEHERVKKWLEEQGKL